MMWTLKKNSEPSVITPCTEYFTSFFFLSFGAAGVAAQHGLLRMVHLELSFMPEVLNEIYHLLCTHSF